VNDRIVELRNAEGDNLNKDNERTPSGQSYGTTTAKANPLS
jgi:hypothetical protein